MREDVAPFERGSKPRASPVDSIRERLEKADPSVAMRSSGSGSGSRSSLNAKDSCARVSGGMRACSFAFHHCARVNESVCVRVDLRFITEPTEKHYSCVGGCCLLQFEV